MGERLEEIHYPCLPFYSNLTSLQYSSLLQLEGMPKTVTQRNRRRRPRRVSAYFVRRAIAHRRLTGGRRFLAPRCEVWWRPARRIRRPIHHCPVRTTTAASDRRSRRRRSSKCMHTPRPSTACRTVLGGPRFWRTRIRIGDNANAA